MVDCKQSGSFSSDLVDGSAYASERRAAREAREAAREENTRALSHKRAHCLARFARRSKKEERLLVVSTIETKKGWNNFFQVSIYVHSLKQMTGNSFSAKI